MSDGVPSSSELTKLEKKVKEDKDVVQYLQKQFKIDDSTEPPPGPTELRLRLFDRTAPDEKYDGQMAVLTAKIELGESIEALEIAREKVRVDQVTKAREEEIYLGLFVDTCPLCNNPLYSGVFDRIESVHLMCCGKQTCKQCFDKGFKKCPVCMHPHPVTPAYAQKKREKFASDGVPYFQYAIGKEYFEGKKSGGINQSNDEKALKYITSAAEVGEQEAQALLAAIYRDNPRGIAETSLEKAHFWTEKAASNGHILAHSNLAYHYLKGQGCEQNIPEYIRLTTFAAHHGILSSQIDLGTAYLMGNIEGIPKSLERAKYWLGKVAHSSEADLMREKCLGVYEGYGTTLLCLIQKNMSGVVDVDGQSLVPEVMYWFRKAKRVAAISRTLDGLMGTCEKLGNSQCMACRSDAKKMTAKCARCHWAYYCGRDCQLIHWKLGHKKECKAKY